MGGTSVEAIIRNNRGEVTASFSAKGPLVVCSEEVEVLVSYGGICSRVRLYRIGY